MNIHPLPLVGYYSLEHLSAVPYAIIFILIGVVLLIAAIRRRKEDPRMAIIGFSAASAMSFCSAFARLTQSYIHSILKIAEVVFLVVAFICLCAGFSSKKQNRR